MEKLLFHICCAPCGGYLSKEFFKDFKPILFFYNPNIWPQEEYEKRLNEVKKFCQQEKIELIEGEDNNQNWLELVKGHEQDLEGGERCKICFRMRLEETARQAKEIKINYFSTSLVISPYKNLEVIKKIGDEIAKNNNLKFVIFDQEKKKNLWPKARNFSHQEHFYYQNYCGCAYSLSLSKFIKNLYNKNMHDSKWDNLIFMIEEKFGIGERKKEPVEISQDSRGESIMGEIESVEFKTPNGEMKIERLSKPKIIDKKVLSSKRIGGKVAVDYVFSDDEKSYEVKLYRLDNGNWLEVDLMALA